MVFDCRVHAFGEPKYVSVNVHFVRLISIRIFVHIAFLASTMKRYFMEASLIKKKMH